MAITHSESLNEIAAALCKAQSVMKGAPKDAQNPHFKSRFASLSSVWEACRGPLTDNGLSVLQMPGAAPEVVVDGEVVSDGRAVTVTTMLLHASGQWIAESLTMTARDASPQSVGSAITYARRYGLQAAVGICPEDDDGNEASHPVASARASDRGQWGPSQPQKSQQPQGNGQPRQHDGPPRSGKALFAWTKEQEQKYEVSLLKYLNSFMKLQDMPHRMVDLSPEDVAICHAEAERKLQAAVGDRSDGEVYHDERDPGQEG